MARGGMRFGAGRPGWHIKAEHCLRLDVRDFARRNLLSGGLFEWHWTESSTGKRTASIGLAVNSTSVTLNFTSDGVAASQHVPLERTACHYGGARLWFRCPRCDRRVALLYHRGGRFACRTCCRLVYASQSEDALGRAWRRQSKLEALLDDGWKRPTGMHHKTRERIVRQIMDCELIRDEAIAQFIERMCSRRAWR
jgi:hypothetical protein